MGRREKWVERAKRLFSFLLGAQNEYFNEKNVLFNNFDVEFPEDLLYTRKAFELEEWIRYAEHRSD